MLWKRSKHKTQKQLPQRWEQIASFSYPHTKDYEQTNFKEFFLIVTFPRTRSRKKTKDLYNTNTIDEINTKWFQIPFTFQRKNIFKKKKVNNSFSLYISIAITVTTATVSITCVHFIKTAIGCENTALYKQTKISQDVNKRMNFFIIMKQRA